jgi:hypothetical protein
LLEFPQYRRLNNSKGHKKTTFIRDKIRKKYNTSAVLLKLDFWINFLKINFEVCNLKVMQKLARIIGSKRVGRGERRTGESRDYRLDAQSLMAPNARPCQN